MALSTSFAYRDNAGYFFFVNMEVAVGYDNKYLGVYLHTSDRDGKTWDKYILRATRIYYEVDGVEYMVQSQNSAEYCQCLIDWLPMRIITPEDPQQNLTTITITRVEAFKNGIWVECVTDSTDLTLTVSVALDADADGTAVLFYPWRFWWGPFTKNCFPNALWGPYKGQKVNIVSGNFWDADGCLIMPRSNNAIRYYSTPASYCMREDDSRVCILPSGDAYFAITTPSGREVAALPIVANRRLRLFPAPDTSSASGEEVAVVVGIFVSLGEEVEFTVDRDVRYWDDIPLGYIVKNRYNAIRPILMEGVRVGIDQPLISTEDITEERPYMVNVKFDGTILQEEYPFLSPMCPYPTPYIMRLPSARNMPTNPLNECEYDCVIYWIDKNGSPYTLPMAVAGGETSSKMRDGGAYDGDHVAVLRSPLLTHEEMMHAVTITESLKIAVKFKEDIYVMYPADVWTWAMVEDVSVVHSYDETSSVVEINLITSKS